MHRDERSREREVGATGVRDRHARAIKQSLRFAQAAADKGEYREALEWLKAVEAADGALPPEWEQTRSVWQARDTDAT